MKIYLSSTLCFFLAISSLRSDVVTINKSNQVYENVKTTPNGRLETILEFKDGTKQILKTKDVTITTAPVVWEETPAQKPGFFKRLFSRSNQEVTQPKSEEEQKSFFDRRFPELAIGTMAVLFLLLP